MGEFWEQDGQEEAEAFLLDWIRRAESADIRMLHKFARTLRFHSHGLLAYYDYAISTGPLEGTNNKIKTMKRQAYGFRDHQFFILKIYAKYPHVNLATSYSVDPAWPQRPNNMPWGQMPGVVVDKQEQVWLLTRAKPPVQVYDASGKFIRAWGGDLVKTAHGLRLDHEGNVWVADCGDHVVMQFTPEGKLLRTLGTRGVPGKDQSHFTERVNGFETTAVRN